MMDMRLTALERAFELARSGTCSTVSDIVRRLKQEGYSVTQVEGRSLKRQLEGLIRTAQETSSQAQPSSLPD